MKITSDILYQWALPDYPEEYIDIDWPAVHKEVGSDIIDWINKQPDENCQLSLEIIPNGRRLIVEFFDQETYSDYKAKTAK